MISLAERLVLLLGAALLLGLGAAVGIHRHAKAQPAAQIEAASSEWFDALAGSRGPAGDAERTTCGLILTARSLGVTEPVLPCGAKVLIRFGDRTFLTSVIDNRLKVAGRQFELTDALAERMGLDGTQRIQWQFAAPRQPAAAAAATRLDRREVARTPALGRVAEPDPVRHRGYQL